MSIRFTLVCLAIIIVLGGIVAGCAVVQNETDADRGIFLTGWEPEPASMGGARQIALLPTLVSPKPTETALEASCLVGRWKVQDLNEVMHNSYADAQTSLSLESIEGEIIYQFTGSGELTIYYNGLAAIFSGLVDATQVEARQVLDGAATAQYQVDDIWGELVLTDFGGAGIVAALDINGQRLAEGNYPVWLAFTSDVSGGVEPKPTSLVAYSRVAVQCSPGELRLQAMEPYPGAEIVLGRKE